MDEPRKNMGMGPLADPALLFVKRNRWTLESEELPEHVVAKVQVLFNSRIVRMSCYEISHLKKAKIAIQDWSEEDFLKKTLTLTTYTGCGTPIYRYKFHNLKIQHESIEFDYADGDPVLREFHVRFGYCVREVFQKGHYVNPKESDDETGTKSRDHSGSQRQCL